MRVFEGGVLLAAAIAASLLLRQEEVPPRTTYETAQRVVRMALDQCWEDLTNNVAKNSDRVTVQQYLACVGRKLEELSTDYEEGDPVAKPEIPKPKNL